MDMVLLGIAVITMLHLIYTLSDFYIGFKKIKPLYSQEVLNDDHLPAVTIIFSALNEADHIEVAVKSMLQLDYPNLEIIAINDRSTDETGTILDQLACRYSNLQVLHIRELRDGWLGKNHALYLGARIAKGEWLLFTDADVIMKPALLKKSLSYVLYNQIDHLTIYEKHLHQDFWLKILSLGTYVTYTMAFKPWRIRTPKPKYYLGHGAFNLVSKQQYENTGGHRSIAFNCLDDVGLGKLFKQKGLKQDTVDGKDFLEREWYHSVSGMIHGLSKNSFAFFNFNLVSVCRDFLFAVLYFLWPFAALFICDGSLFWLNAVNAGLLICASGYIAKKFQLKSWYAVLFPVAMIMLLYTIWHSVILTYKNKGIVWRNTHYKLKELKRLSIPAEIKP